MSFKLTSYNFCAFIFAYLQLALRKNISPEALHLLSRILLAEGSRIYFSGYVSLNVNDIGAELYKELITELHLNGLVAETHLPMYSTPMLYAIKLDAEAIFQMLQDEGIPLRVPVLESPN